jgi:hypothetical protein
LGVRCEPNPVIDFDDPSTQKLQKCRGFVFGLTRSPSPICAMRDDRLRARPATFCPVIRATGRALGLALGNVQVGKNTICISYWKGYHYLDVTATKKLEHAITTFDREQQMQPGSFRINVTP